ncbi:MAG: hypothetical protein KKA64_02195 [Nanoarchaeota archaeon]|nr:hypothetical protein [Nanoarchaeota archaeon]
MLQKTSEEFRTLFLIKFTEELINHSKTAEAVSIEKLLREKINRNIEKKEEEKIFHEIISKKNLNPKKAGGLRENFRERISQMHNHPLSVPMPPRLTTPSQKIPSAIQNITPMPSNIQLDLGKLNSFVKDPTLTDIECEGAGKNILVKRMNNTRQTQVILSKEEIDNIIQRFSQEAKIPVETGIFKVAVGSLVMSAIISDIIGSKFIISKMFYR